MIYNCVHYIIITIPRTSTQLYCRILLFSPLSSLTSSLVASHLFILYFITICSIFLNAFLASQSLFLSYSCRILLLEVIPFLFDWLPQKKCTSSVASPSCCSCHRLLLFFSFLSWCICLFHFFFVFKFFIVLRLFIHDLFLFHTLTSLASSNGSVTSFLLC